MRSSLSLSSSLHHHHHHRHHHHHHHHDRHHYRHHYPNVIVVMIIIIINIFRSFVCLFSNHLEYRSSYSCFLVQGGFAMKREKTVIDVDVSEEKQRQIVQSLFREHTNVGMKFERERTRQEEMVSFCFLSFCSSLQTPRDRHKQFAGRPRASINVGQYPTKIFTVFYKTLFAVGRNNWEVQIPNNINLKLEANFVLFCFFNFVMSLPTKQLGVRNSHKLDRAFHIE